MPPSRWREADPDARHACLLSPKMSSEMSSGNYLLNISPSSFLPPCGLGRYLAPSIPAGPSTPLKLAKRPEASTSELPRQICEDIYQSLRLWVSHHLYQNRRAYIEPTWLDSRQFIFVIYMSSCPLKYEPNLWNPLRHKGRDEIKARFNSAPLQIRATTFRCHKKE